MRPIILKNGWEVCEQPLKRKADEIKTVMRSKAWIQAAVPGDVREDLRKAGKVQEPSTGLNYKESMWIEERSWWYRIDFNIPKNYSKADRIDLNCAILDINADIFLNDTHLGLHKTAFRPFLADIKEHCLPGKTNRLIIRLNAGSRDLNAAERKEAKVLYSRIPNKEKRYDPAMTVRRKPAFCYGWDWTARIVTCGIGGPVTITPRRIAHIKDIHAESTLPSRSRAKVTIKTRINSCSDLSDTDIAVHTAVYAGKSQIFRKIQNCLLGAGTNTITFECDIEKPRLWWPHGQGEQFLYRIETEIHCGDTVLDSCTTQFGIRTININQSRINAKERHFAIEINGRAVFCKGGNWVPADPLPARIKPQRYETLIKEARNLNFNMLRIWGGGLYEPKLFYDLCDKYGIMVWHDFMFACSAYPEDDAFKTEIRYEAEYQIQRLRNHPSIVLWCGNNEINWGTADWNRWNHIKRWGGSLYSEVLSEAVQLHSPSTPYWVSSPWGGSTPNSPDAGDRHCWELTMNPDETKRVTPELYDEQTTKFASEYGHIGPPLKTSVLQYLGDKSHYCRKSRVFKEHVNYFARKPNNVNAAVSMFYGNPDTMSLDDYILYGGLAQGVQYGYSLEAFRYRRGECMGALFWMYNDCWGEFGWTVIDYYLRRKISWYYTKRAFAPLRVILRRSQKKIQIKIINDQPQSINGELEFGWFAHDGSRKDTTRIHVHVRAAAALDAIRFTPNPQQMKTGTYTAIFTSEDGQTIDIGIFRAGNYKDLDLPPAKPAIISSRKVKGGRILTIAAKTFAHAVHFTALGKGVPDDNYFDLLPNVPIKVFIADCPQKINVKAINT